MASVTLVESAKLSQNLLVKGVIQNVITVNPFYEVLPFTDVYGNALAYNRENALGAVQRAEVGDTIAAGKAAATFTQVTTSLVKILGDAEVDGLIQATRSDKNDQKGIQIASKAKSVGRQYQDDMINGTGVAPQMEGLLSLLAAGQTVSAAGANGDALSFATLDEGMDKVTDKDGVVDYIMMHSRTIRSYYALLRALGGASIGDTVQLPSGRMVPAYRHVPIFRNDYIPIDQTVGATNTCTTVLFGTLDDGSRAHGIAGLNAQDASGIVLEEVGISETKDETITRIKWYCGLANFSVLGLAGATGITD